MSVNRGYAHSPAIGTTVFICKIDNKTSQSLSLSRQSLPWGSWAHEPPAIIKPKQEDYFKSEGTELIGTQGAVEYSLPDAGFDIDWSVVPGGDNIVYNFNKTDPNNLYKMDLRRVADQVEIHLSDNT